LASRRALVGDGQTSIDRAADARDAGGASLVRAGKVWHVAWREEHGSIPHAKGLADIAALVRQPGREISALELAGGWSHAGQSRSELIDIEALRAYRNRLQELDDEIERADDHADIGHVERLGKEREQLVSEVRHASDPGERARKAVSARLRDAVRRLHAVAPLLAAHLDRSIHTGLRCVYRPAADDPVHWHVRD
jgi:hypothetical protein